MYLINLKNSTVLEKTEDESVINIWYQKCQEDSTLLVTAKWPIPKMKIENGILISKKESEWTVPNDISLEDLRFKRKRELFAKYSEKCEEGVVFEGEIFQTNEKSATRIGLALQDWVRGIQTPYWIRKDDTHHQIDSYPQLDSLAISISLRWKTLLHIYTTLRDEIDIFQADSLLTLNVISRWEEIEKEITN
ncbi:hypothetical protein CH379_017925 [Leptospira ellisii]|uniref:DUF4376 domain-containing protein n=1 Tax=Leptospira ellisii TaxID=2023197 RepID=A0A2N0B3D3_9LEPT|nr:hypothetical protein [Leptospira ellisii]MDV6237514.1 hypothetical protein [Leptospira ellisii]PJZ91046.1 hypothetical protein CH379_20880 [Leptospira ellisii]PKA03508.1 hypothetical protein CH375_16575 [Leptospira ellisii]